MLLLRQFAGYLLARGVPGVFTFLTIAAFSRLLTPAEYGVYALAYSTVRVGYAILFEWLSLGLVRFWTLCDERGSLNKTIGRIFIGTAVLIIALGVLGWILFDHPTSTLIVLSALTLVAYAWFELLLQEIRLHLQPIRYGIVSTVKVTVWLAAGSGLAYVGFGAFGAVGGLLISLVLANALGEALVPGSGSSGRPSKELAHQIIAYALPLSGTFALGYIVSSSDRFVIAALLGEAEAGLYSVGYDVARQSIGMLAMTVNLAGFPLALSAFDRGGKEEARTQLNKNATLLIAAVVPAATGISVLARDVSTVTLGAEFVTAGSTIIPWIAAASVLEVMKGNYMDHAYHLMRRTKAHLLNVASVALTNIALNFVLIPRFGIVGAAYATLISYAVGLGITVVHTRSFLPMPIPYRDVGKVIIASATMGAVVSILPVGHTGIALGARIGAGMIVFGIAVIALDVSSIRRSLAQTIRTKMQVAR